jgi:hypothetical protein
MRIVGTILMLFGAFALVAVALTVFGPGFHAEGIAVHGVVTSVPGTLATGVCALIAGAYVRRRARRRAIAGPPPRA